MTIYVCFGFSELVSVLDESWSVHNPIPSTESKKWVAVAASFSLLLHILDGLCMGHDAWLPFHSSSLVCAQDRCSERVPEYNTSAAVATKPMSIPQILSSVLVPSICVLLLFDMPLFGSLSTPPKEYHSYLFVFTFYCWGLNSTFLLVWTPALISWHSLHYVLFLHWFLSILSQCQGRITLFKCSYDPFLSLSIVHTNGIDRYFWTMLTTYSQVSCFITTPTASFHFLPSISFDCRHVLHCYANYFLFRNVPIWMLKLEPYYSISLDSDPKQHS